MMIASKFLNPRNDLAFKRIFGSEKHKDILIHFLNDILERPSPITEVTYLKTIQDPEIAPLRVTIVDVMCQDQDGHRFVIEMQVSHEKSFDKRALYYAARAYCSQKSHDMGFKDLKDVYFLAITDFTPFPNKKSWLSRIGLKDLDTNEHDISAIQLYFLQLPRFKKTKADLETMTTKEKWAYFFKYADATSEEELERLIGNDVIIRKAYDVLNRFGWSEFELNDYESAQMKKDADEACMEAAYDKGSADGEKKAKLEIAKRLLSQTIAISEVSKLTGLDEIDLSKLMKN